MRGRYAKCGQAGAGANMGASFDEAMGLLKGLSANEIRAYLRAKLTPKEADSFDLRGHHPEVDATLYHTGGK